ncbi:hypothetical protein HB795_03180 [Listeria welshimeri]|nr:hypothetical protein [Listeria welshimeri]MBC1389343.1 hypothetical protein [Listeria welshimeri]MBC2289684.1 hypothetical protein [Listeria welshimeri]
MEKFLFKIKKEYVELKEQGYNARDYYITFSEKEIEVNGKKKWFCPYPFSDNWMEQERNMKTISF